MKNPIIDKNWPHRNNNPNHFIFSGFVKKLQNPTLNSFLKAFQMCNMFFTKQKQIKKNPNIYLPLLHTEDLFNIFSHCVNLAPSIPWKWSLQ